jgi:hypothetical protein
MDVNAINELYGKATAGEWFTPCNAKTILFSVNNKKHTRLTDVGDANDAAFIAAAHNLMPELLKLAGRAQAAERDLKELNACTHCAHNAMPKPCEKVEIPDEKTMICLAWQWRGPAESEAGNV